MRAHTQAHFELRLIPDQSTWEILVTWGHALRDRVEGLTFASEREGALWIERRSVDWLRSQNGPMASALFPQTSVVIRRRRRRKTLTRSKGKNPSKSSYTKTKVAQEIRDCSSTIAKLKQRLERLEIGQH